MRNAADSCGLVGKRARQLGITGLQATVEGRADQVLLHVYPSPLKKMAYLRLLKPVIRETVFKESYEGIDLGAGQAL